MKESEGLYRSFRFLKKALLGVAAVVLALLLFGYFFFMRHVDAPKAWTAADRELRGGMLQYGEKVQRTAKVFMRRPSDYYRGANGVLYATNDRLIFIGVAPGSKFESADAPPMIVSQEFPNDTLLDLRGTRLYFLTAHGVRVSHPGVPRGEFAAIRGQEAALDSLTDYVNTIHASQRKEAASERRLRQAVDALIKQPLYYTVRRGDALSLIATKFGATADQIRQWNQLEGDRVKIGQRLLVKPAKK
ncbi:MAG TPA: LysM peptidoglycan-binding domain-containing protein, partial [Gemmatimonadaceae bacterium]|nr:LysM peptidoglycan-binding domain-containing protein [Gemmatimonadaceae bacterium]